MTRPEDCSATFHQVYRSYQPRVRRLAARLFGEADADDITQEAMLRLFRHLDRLDTGRELWPWMVTVTRHVGVDLVRTRRRTVPVEPDALADLAPALPDDAATALLRAAEQRLVGTALGRLGRADQEVLRLRELDERPLEEIASLCGITGNAVRQRLFRARRHLATEYRALGGHAQAGCHVVGSLLADKAILRLTWLRAERPGGAAVAGIAAGLLSVGAGVNVVTQFGIDGFPPHHRTRPAAVVDEPSFFEAAASTSTPDVVEVAARRVVEVVRNIAGSKPGGAVPPASPPPPPEPPRDFVLVVQLGGRRPIVVEGPDRYCSEVPPTPQDPEPVSGEVCGKPVSGGGSIPRPR